MWHCLATIEPLDPVSGERQPLHASSADLASICALDGKVWEPAIATPPQLAIRLFNGDLETSIEPGAARLPLAMGVLKETYPDADTYDWSGAPISIYAGKAGEAWPWRRVFRGSVREFGREGQLLTLRGEVDTAPFAADLLTAYEGTGGAAGGPDLKGKLKPLIFGHAMNVEPVLLDAIDNVYQFSGYGPIEAVSALFERGSNFGPAVADYADFAALVAATIEPGDWATCLAEGLVRLGAPAHGVITGDVRGHTVGATTPRLTGAIISAAAQMAGVDPALIDAGTLSTLDADKPFPVNIVISEQTKFIDLARRLARPCNHQAGVSLTGLFFVTKVDFAPAAVLGLDGQGASLPEVKEVTEGTTSPPYAKFTLGANRCWRVQTPDEIAFQAEIVDRGLYEASATYREGNIVSSPDRSRWIYVNPTAGSGNAPPVWPTTSNAHWENIEPPATAGDLTYEDGTPIEALKPAEPGATEGAPPGTPVGDRPAEDVVNELDQHTAAIATAESNISQAQADIAGLITTYGDTASAAESAAQALAAETAAEAARDLAAQHAANSQLAEQNAEQANTDAQAAKVLVEDAVADAVAQAQAAAGSATEAENFTITAAASAASATEAAQKALATSMPERYTTGDETNFTINEQGDPNTVATANDNAILTGWGPVYQINRSANGTSLWGQKNLFSALAGRVYEVEIEAEVTAFTGAPTLRGRWGQLLSDYTYASVGSTNASVTITETGAYSVVCRVSDVADASMGIQAWAPDTVHLRPSGAITADGSSSATVQFKVCAVRDITSRVASERAAEAASVSAQTASTKADEASASAQSASADANIATTRAGEAAGSATAASTSASAAEAHSDAAGNSASSAQQSATTATTKASEAAASADAAATSESSAAASETAAGASASAAQAARTGAETARTEAQTARNEAVTAKEDAEGAAATATTQAGISASAATTAQNALDSSITQSGNNDLTDGPAGWGIQLDGAGSIENYWQEAFGDRAGVVLSPASSRRDIGHKRRYPIDPSRSYRIWGIVRAFGASTQNLIGCRSLDSNGNPIGTNSGLTYASTGTSAPSESWVTVERIFSGETSGPDVVEPGKFRQGTRQINLIGILNYGNAAGAQTALDGLWIEDVTDSLEAEGFANASADSASTAAAQATSASQSAQAANTSKLDAETARSQAQGFRNEAVSARDEAAGSASSAAISEAIVAESRKRANATLADTFPRVLDPALLNENLVTSGNPYQVASIEQTAPAWIDANRTSVTPPAGHPQIGLNGLLRFEQGRTYRLYADIEIIAAGSEATVRTAFYGRMLGASFEALGNIALQSQAFIDLAQGQRGVIDYEYTRGAAVEPSVVWWRPGLLINRLPSVSGNPGAQTTLHALWAQDITESKKAESSAIAAASSASTATTKASEAEGYAATATQQAGLSVAAKNDAQTAAGVAEGHAASADADAASAASSASLSAAYSKRGPGDSFNGDLISATGWYITSTQSAPAPSSMFTVSGSGRTIFLSNAGARANLYGERMEVDTARKYRTVASVANATAGSSRVYIGFACYDAAGNLLPGNGGTFNYTVNQVISSSSSYADFFSEPITGEGSSSALTFPVGTKTVAPLAFLNYENAAGVRTALDKLYIEDITGQVAAEAAADIAETQATTATNQAAAASADRQLTAQYRQDALGARDTATTQAGIAQSNATVATAQAAAAQQSASLAASVGQGFLDPNAGFDDYPNASVGQLPAGWINWSGSASMYREPDGLGGYGVRMPAAAGASAGLRTVSPSQSTVSPGDWFVLRGELRLNSGTLQGVGIYFPIVDINGAIVLSSLRLSFADEFGNGAAGRTYRLTKLVQIPPATTAAHRHIVYAMGHWPTIGSVAAANDVTWLKCGATPATQEEIDTGTVLPTLEATVSSQGQVLQDLDTSFASLENTVQAQGATVTQHSSAIAQTQGDVTTLFGKVGVTIDIDGYQVGWEQNNDGDFGSTKFRTDYFEVSSPGGGPGLTWTKDANNRPTLKVDDGAGSTVEIGWCP